MKVAIVTCTGKRPRMMPLCKRWVEHQTIRPDLWVISLGRDEEVGVDDLPDYARVHRWDIETVGQPMHGQIDTNSKYQIEVLRQVPEGYAATYFDDDDWYGPEYLHHALRGLNGCGFSGNGQERRYSLKLGAWMEVSKSGCNAGAVTIAPHAIAAWIEWLQDPSTKWDLLTREFGANLRNGAPRVSIKHGPGLGHLFPPSMHKWRKDVAMLGKLREWIGDDVRYYEELLRA